MTKFLACNWKNQPRREKRQVGIVMSGVALVTSFLEGYELERELNTVTKVKMEKKSTHLA